MGYAEQCQSLEDMQKKSIDYEKLEKEIEQLKEKLRRSDNMCGHLARHIKELGK